MRNCSNIAFRQQEFEDFTQACYSNRQSLLHL